MGYVSLGLAFSDLPGDPSGDVCAGWWRAKRINAVSRGRPGMVDSGGLGRAAVEGGGEAIESIVAIGVGEVGALFTLVLEVGEIEGVVLPATAHRNVGPLAVGGPVDDHEGAVGGDALGFVTGHRVAVVDVPLI